MPRETDHALVSTEEELEKVRERDDERDPAQSCRETKEMMKRQREARKERFRKENWVGYDD